MKVHLKINYLTAAVLLAGTMLAGIAANVRTANAADCTVSDTLVNSCRPWLGATVGGYSQTTSDYASQFAYGEQRLNNPNVLTDPSSPTTVTSQYDLIHRYHSPTQTSFDTSEVNSYNRDGTYLYINWKPDTVWANAGGTNATDNARIDAMADSIKALGSKKIFLTVFHEPENDVSSGNCTTNGGSAASGSPTDYVNMWHNVRARFDAKGVTNVVWTMNYMGYSGWNCLVPLLWPGNTYVDWITYDPYGGGTNSSTLFNDSVSPFYNYLSQTSDSTHDYLSKPWGLAEHGAWANGGTTQASAIDYWNQAKAAVQNNTYPKLKMYMAFDTSVNGSSQVGTDFSGQPSIDEQTAYNGFANAVLATTPPAPVLPVINSVTPSSGTLSGTANFTVNTNEVVNSVSMSVDGQTVGTSSSAPFTFALDTNAYTNASHTITFTATDASGNSTTSTASYTFLNTPIIYSVTPGSGTISGTKTFTVSTNKEVSSVTIRVDNKWVATDSSAPWALTLNTKNYKNGTHSIGFKAWDDNGKYADKVITFTIKN